MLTTIKERLGGSVGVQLTLFVREELFHFTSEPDWIQAAQVRFRNHGHTAQSTICIDSAGLVCARGLHFQQAVYPVRVYAIDDAPYAPAGMRGARQEAHVEPEAAR